MNSSKGPAGRRRASSGSSTNTGMRLNSSISDRRRARQQSRAAAHAEYLSTLPKDRWKRLAYRMHPKRVAEFWFSREGAIMALKIIGVGIVVCFFLTIGLFAYFRKDLPKIKDISGGNLGGSITYYDSTGQVILFQDYNAVKRIPVETNNISPYLKDATVAIEDKNFYKEGAFDVRGIMRAATHDVVGGGGSLQGGSTITQQLVKLNEGWTNDRTISRKVKELILAVELEREYSKSDILTGYLNIAPYGGIEYGAEAASEDYFQTSAKNLTLPQASMLAAIPQAPGAYSPYGSTEWNSAASGTFNKQALLNRQHYILDQMAKQGYISQDQANQAKQVDILSQVHPLSSKYNNIKAPYFVMAAKQELEQKYGASTVQRGGWRVTTTLNLDLQNHAEQDIAKNSRNVASIGGDTQAMVAEDVKTGQIVAEVGGEDWTNPDYGQINYANTNVAPGSSLKPFLYAALIQNNTNVGAGSVLYDSQGPLPGYPCTDTTRPTATSNGGNCLWDDNFVYPGAETIRYALAGSRNVPAVKAAYEIIPGDTSNGYTKSVNKWISMANAAIGTDNAYGCYPAGTNLQTATADDQTQCYGSAALGSGAVRLDEEVNGDATFARMGQEIPQTHILSITDSAGKQIYKWTQPKPTQVYNQDTAYIVNNMLSDPRASYLTSAQKFQNYKGWNIAVKTGTENQEFNGLMTAWSTQYAVIGFVGYHTLNKPLKEGHFEDVTEPITRSWMEYALDALNTKPVNWTQPSDIKVLPAYVQRTTTGFGAQVPGPTNELFPSWYTGNKGSSATETIDKVSGGLATSCTPGDAKQTVGGANDSSFSIDIFYPTKRASSTSAASNTSTATPDNVHNCNDAKPTVTLTAPSTCSATDNGGQGCQISAVVTAGTHPLTGGGFGGTVSLTINGTIVSTQTLSDPNVDTVYFPYYKPTSDGTATVSVTATDSVLYQSTQSTSMTTAAATQPNPPGNGNGGGHGNGGGPNSMLNTNHETLASYFTRSLSTASGGRTKPRSA